MGRAGEVLTELQRLQAHMQTLPSEGGPDEPAYPWNVREALLDTGREAALRLGRWADALELNAAVTASQRDRGEPADGIARGRFNDYGPLIRLGRVSEALELLLECRQAFETAHDIQMLGNTLTALADVEDERGHGEAAITLQRNALRYSYLVGNVTATAINYNNLGNYLARYTRQLDTALACHLTAALISALTGSDRADGSARAAAGDLRQAGAGRGLPEDVAALCAQVAGIPGADLGRLIAALAPEPDTAERVFGELLVHVQDLASPPLSAGPRNLAAWDPVIGALLAAEGGDAEASAMLDAELDRYQDSSDWGALVTALRRVRAGDTGGDVLANLNEIDTAIGSRALNTHDEKVSILVALWPAIQLRWWLADVVAGARGDETAAERARESIKKVAEVPDLQALTGIFRRILDGERDPGLGTGLDDPTDRAVVATVLEHIGS